MTRKAHQLHVAESLDKGQQMTTDKIAPESAY